MTAYIATGIAVSFGTLNAELIDVNASGEEADMVETTTQSAPDDEKDFAGALIDKGDITLMLAFDPDATIPALKTKDTLTVTWVSGKTWVRTAILKKKSGVSASLGTRITEEIAFKIVPTPAG